MRPPPAPACCRRTGSSRGAASRGTTGRSRVRARLVEAVREVARPRAAAAAPASPTSSTSRPTVCARRARPRRRTAARRSRDRRRARRCRERKHGSASALQSPCRPDGERPRTDCAIDSADGSRRRAGFAWPRHGARKSRAFARFLRATGSTGRKKARLVHAGATMHETRFRVPASLKILKCPPAAVITYTCGGGHDRAKIRQSPSPHTHDAKLLISAMAALSLLTLDRRSRRPTRQQFIALRSRAHLFFFFFFSLFCRLVQHLCAQNTSYHPSDLGLDE